MGQDPSASLPEGEVAAEPSAANGEQPVSPVFEQLRGKIEQVGPDTYILLDKEGRPTPVVNMQMGIEQFIAAWKNQRAWAKSSDVVSQKYTLDECRLDGALAGSRASLHAAIDITLHQEGMVEVPLSLAGSLLEQLPEPPANQQGKYLRFDAGQGGYLATVSGKAGERVRVELDLITPVRRDGSRATLRLLAPRAVKSSLVLTTGESVQSVVASEGVQLTVTPQAEGGTHIEAEGVAGESSVSWVDRPRETESRESVLSAKSKQIVILDGRQVRQLVRLTVESAGPSFRDFTVRLPPGAQYKDNATRSLSSPVESIKEIQDTSERVGSTGRERTELLITLEADEAQAVSVELETTQAMPAGEQSEIHLSGFEVVGALPQEGEAAVVVDPALQLRWQPTDALRPVHPQEVDLSWSSSLVEQEDVQAAFQFSRQPWNLAAVLVERQRRVVATRDYELQINSSDATLQMEVRYRIEGGRTLPVLFAPRFALEGWELERTTTVNIEGLQEEGLGEPTLFAPSAEEADQPQSVGFENAQANSRLPVVTLWFRRTLPEVGKGFELTLPYPDHDAVVLNPSEVAVIADPSVKLKPADMQTLSPEAVTPEDDLIAGLSPGQVFQYRGVLKKLVFAGERELRPRRTIVASDADVRMAVNETTVEQVLSLDVRHQSTSSVLLTKPSGIENLRLDLLLSGSGASAAGTPLEVATAAAGAGSSSATVPEMRITLPHPRLGQFRLQARYRVATQRSSDETAIIPLLSVPGAESAGSIVRLDSAFASGVVPAVGSNWQTGDATASAGSQIVELRADTLASFLPLSLVGASRVQDRVDVQRIWVQTWLTPATTQVRTVFEFRSDSPRVRVELPADAPPGSAYEVVLDQEPLGNWTRVQDALEIDLPTGGESARHVLEMRYRLSETMPWTKRLATERPRLVGSEHGAELFWQIVTPVEYQPVSAARALVPAYHREWSGWDWRVQSEFDAHELEQWTGASQRLEPSEGEHAILYRGIDASPLEVTLARRELLVLAASTAALLVMLLLVYVPWLRRASVVLGAVCVLAAVGLAAPRLTASIARLGLYGVLCGIATWVLWLLFGVRSPRTVTMTPSHSPRGDASSLQRPSNLVPLATGSQSMSSAGVSSNAPTVSLEWTDSNA